MQTVDFYKLIIVPFRGQTRDPRSDQKFLRRILLEFASFQISQWHPGSNDVSLEKPPRPVFDQLIHFWFHPPEKHSITSLIKALYIFFKVFVIPHFWIFLRKNMFLKSNPTSTPVKAHTKLFIFKFAVFQFRHLNIRLYDIIYII